MPRFEFSDGRSNKFWEITLSGNEYHVQYGRIGTVGQSSSKSFANAATAKTKYEAAIKGKVNKGYVEISQANLTAEEDDEAARLVLADTMQQKGDPRGVLVALQHRIEQVSGKERATIKRQESALFEENKEAFLGVFAKDGPRECFKCEWKLGYWDKVIIFSSYDHEEIKTAGLLKEALQHPSGEHLRELQCGIPESVWDGESNWQDYINVITKVGAPQLRKLHLADDDDNAEISWCQIGNLDAMWKAVPQLEFLRIRGIGMSMGDIDAPKLAMLQIHSGGVPSEAIRDIGKAMTAGKMPELERVELWLGCDEYGCDCSADDVQGILNAKKSPKLTWLGLMNAEIANDLCRVVHGGSIVKQLETLNMSMGTMTDEGAEVLLQHAKAFAHLKQLDVSDNYLSSGMCKRLRDAMPNVVTGSQKDPNEDGEDDPWYYTSVAE